MPKALVIEQRTCPTCGKTFDVGGRGRRPRKAIYCSWACGSRVGSDAPRPKKNADTVHNEEWLRARYIDDRMTMGQIAEMVGCSRQSVYFQMRKRGIVRRLPAESMPRRSRPRGPARGGLTLAEYQVLHDAQGGLCAACGQPETKAHRNGAIIRLAVDHDHATGRVRALLCSRCNYTLGYARDDPSILRALIAYLESHPV